MNLNKNEVEKKVKRCREAIGAREEITDRSRVKEGDMYP